MDALILFAHGSLLCGAGEALFAHAERLRARGDFAIVEVGFLNYNAPTFDEAVARCAAAGATRIVVVPYFLVPGKFATIDLPERVATARRAWPNMEFVIAEPIGYDEALADAVLALAEKARPFQFWREDYRRAAAFCVASPQCPLYGTLHCPKTSVSSSSEAA